MNSNQRAPTPAPTPPSRVATAGVPPKTSAAGRFFRGLLRWVTAIALVFCLGVLAMWYVRVRPQTEQISQLQTQNSALQKRINGPQPQFEILECLLDVSKAQVALVQGGQDSARQALSGTDARLTKLEQELPPDQTHALQDARNRLALVLGEMGSNSLAARNDLEVLSYDLASLQLNPTPAS
jgi:septal ring factor EnvC (AmiA/AmiB activator)